VKPKDAREAYYYYSGKASDISRTLAFAGIALIWVFKIEIGNQARIPAALLFPAFLIAASLGADLLQYIYGTLAWGIYHRYRERKYNASEEMEFEAPSWMNWGTNALFALKLLLITWGFVLVLSYALRQWNG